MTVTDGEIVQLMLAPESQNAGLRHLMTRYQERLYWVVRNIVESHDDANDIIQNTFIKAYKNIAGFEARASLFTWLYRIATNEALTFRKSAARKATVTMTDYSLNSNPRVAETENSEDEIMQKLQLAINELPDRQRQVFEMRYYSELSYEEIGRLLGLTEGALKASYHHAVKKIEQIVLNTSTY